MSTITPRQQVSIDIYTDLVQIPLSCNAEEAKTLNKMYQELKKQIRIESTKREVSFKILQMYK